MKKISLLLSGIAFIGVLTVGIFQFSKTDQLATHGHYPAPSYSVGDYGGAPTKFNVNVFKNPPNGGFLNGFSACSIRA
ncbi:hypothetical protein ACT7DZ_39030 [Bacillus cereus]